MKLLWDI